MRFVSTDGQSSRQPSRKPVTAVARLSSPNSIDVQLRPDVLVALGDLTAGAVKSATTTISVVSMSGDPVGAGLVASLARPGGNTCRTC
jgi:ABC-type uncharacterized transport system substrate-binding protein